MRTLGDACALGEGAAESSAAQGKCRVERYQLFIELALPLQLSCQLRIAIALQLKFAPELAHVWLTFADSIIRSGL